MKTIKEPKLENQIEIKRSKFIALAFKVVNIQEVTDILYSLTELHPNATHICFAYNVENNFRAFDDGEPSGTAGKPILNVINQKELVNILVVVIRYFGGIKLGAGGLVRAYTQASTSVLDKAEIVEVKTVNQISFHISYDQAFNIYILLNYGYFKIIQRVGNDFIIECPPEKLEESLDAIKKYNVSNILINSIKV